MPSTYEPIATTTLGSTATSVTFSSITGSYTDLVLIFGGKGSTGGNVTFQFNSDTGSNYSSTIIYGDGSSAGSVRGSNQSSMNIGSTGTDITTNTFSLMNYSNATTYKTVLGRYSRADEVGAKVGLWRSTSAITNLVVAVSGGNFSIGSTFTLYGIKAA
jgi:peptide methionine sulfoxide reductase MsrA